MRILIVLWVVGVAFLSACTAGEPLDTEAALEGAEEGDVTAITLITPEPDEACPGAENPYPVSPVEALLPTGYPELTVVAPSGEVDPNELTPQPSDGTLQVMPSPGRPNATPFPVPALILTALTRDLATRADVTSDEIQVISAEPVVWPNGGLGCPAEGMAYAEVQVEGMLVTLEANGQSYTYHTDGAKRYVLCQDGSPVAGGAISRSQ